ncbi:fungal-specific transcription factor domain-containing protein [Paraphoma chrysanthemicola]|uniref:Fungal-specific transcription factor domain-containing protein n=1 Tax=Paraphoma chrysanthemicola TaxID=798071 RepID=A0A8K0VT94_9PLEO|nr:fungal-specific transcription factor domain-containing protein [Paraphoma chrysanthemicola]
MQSPLSPSERSQARKFTIQSRFGLARAARSRKNRPCDVCRRRKTACVISEQPPCVFCKSRGFDCTSTPRSGSEPRRSPSFANDVPHGSSPVEAPPSPAAGGAGPSPATRQAAVTTDPGAISTNGITISTIAVSSGPSQSQRTFVGDASIGSLNLPYTGPSRPHPAVQPLEGIPGRTAHSMGLTAEQDSQLLSTFRSVIFSERDEIDANIVQVFAGDSYSQAPPVHFMLLQDEFPDHTNQAMQKASDAIEAIVGPHALLLVRIYFKHIHPAYPIISKVRFLHHFSFSKEAIPASLRGAVYALASAFWEVDSSQHGPCPFAQHELVTLAQDSLRRELEAPNIYKLQACLLLLHMRPPNIDSVETPYTWIMTAQATVCAQMIGLHRDATQWNIPLWEKMIRKRLWWAVFAADCWSAVCHGNPPHIGIQAFNTTELKLEDMRHGEDVPDGLQSFVDPTNMTFDITVGARFIASSQLARQLRIVLDCASQVELGREQAQPGSSHQSQLQIVRRNIQDWFSLLPQCLSQRRSAQEPNVDLNAHLYVSHFAVLALLFRGLMYSGSRESQMNSDSNLRNWHPAALTTFEAFTRLMLCMTEEDLAGFWIRHARSQFIICGNFLIYLFLTASSTQQVEAAYRLLESFHTSLQRLGSTGNEDARLRLRPVMLRVNSFFKQAAALIGSNNTPV